MNRASGISISRTKIKKWLMWLEKFMARYGIKGYGILLRGDVKTPPDKK